MTFDVIIVGGSYAGISAGMQLARARRRVLVMDTGLRRNRFARASHGFLGQDGRDPAAIADDARAQLLAYPSVEWLSEAAVAAKKEADGFVVKAANGERFTARRLILASGVADELPEIPGLAERWGRHVFHCPYCHGYELDGGPIGVLAASPLAIHHALMLPDWGATTFFLNGVFEPDAEQMSRLDRRGVTIEREAVVALGGARADVTWPVAARLRSRGCSPSRVRAWPARWRRCSAASSRTARAGRSSGPTACAKPAFPASSPAATRRWRPATSPSRWATARAPVARRIIRCCSADAGG